MLEGSNGGDKDLNKEAIDGRQFEQAISNTTEFSSNTGNNSYSEISTGRDMSQNTSGGGSDNYNAGGKDSSGGIVVARGTGDGLILRLDGRVERHILLSTLLDYVESRKSFFSGQEVTLEWIEARPEEGVVAELSEALSSRFQLLVKASRMFERSSGKKSNPNAEKLGEDTHNRNFSKDAQYPLQKMRPTPVSPKMGERSPASLAPNSLAPGSLTSNQYNVGILGGQGGSSLFDGVAALSGSSANLSNTGNSNLGLAEKRPSASEALLWDEADTRIIRDTLRGGQKIESEHSVVIQGDVNSGAEIVAGGDIFVLGRLRGVAHAGAYDESGGGRKIFALQMQPTQLRIGSVISQGSEEGGRMPEMAKIEGNMIVVEPYGAASSVRRLSK